MTQTPTRHLGRNLNLSADGVFTKTLTGPAADVARRLRNCLAWEDCARSNGLSVSPALLDSSEVTLVHEYVRTTWDPAELANPADETAPEVLEAAGEALAQVHGAHYDFAEGHRGPDPAVRHHYLLETTLDHYTRHSAAELTLLAMLHRDRAFRQAMLDLDTAAGPRVPVHGDMRLDQVLRVAPGRVLLVDFEEFAPGLPEWDLAGVLASVALVLLAGSIAGAAVEAGPNDTPQQLHTAIMTSSRRGLDRYRDCAAVFLGGYHKHREVPEPAVLGQETGLALLNRVMARAAMQSRLSSVDRAIAGIGRQAVINPIAAQELVP